MPRAKSIPDRHNGYTVQELIAKHGLDPMDELFQIIHQTHPYPETGDPERDKEIMDSLRESWEPYEDEKGRIRLRLKTSKKIAILTDLCSYSYAKLRGVEVRGTIDNNFNITIQTFDNQAQAKVIDVAKEALQLNESNSQSS